MHLEALCVLPPPFFAPLHTVVAPLQARLIIHSGPMQPKINQPHDTQEKSLSLELTITPHSAHFVTPCLKGTRRESRYFRSPQLTCPRLRVKPNYFFPRLLGSESPRVRFQGKPHQTLFVCLFTCLFTRLSLSTLPVTQNCIRRSCCAHVFNGFRHVLFSFALRTSSNFFLVCQLGDSHTTTVKLSLLPSAPIKLTSPNTVTTCPSHHNVEGIRWQC